MQRSKVHVCLALFRKKKENQSMLVVSVISKYYVIWHSAHNFPAAKTTFFYIWYWPPALWTPIDQDGNRVGQGRGSGSRPRPDPRFTIPTLASKALTRQNCPWPRSSRIPIPDGARREEAQLDGGGDVMALVSGDERFAVGVSSRAYKCGGGG